MARGFNYAAGASAEVQEAQQPGLDKARILELASSRNNLVRAAIGARSDCPLGLMVTLAHDYASDVRCAVASNPAAQMTVMAYLSTDKSTDVIKALLTNPSLPAGTVEMLAFHKKADVRAAAAARLDAGVVSAPRAAEDSHTPELAEHVAPIAAEQPVAFEVPVLEALPATADGMTVTPPGNVVDISTGAPVPTGAVQATPQSSWHATGLHVPAEPHAEAPQPSAAEPAPAERHIAQIFTPHSTPDAPAPTRTAPVRGFKPPKS